MLGVPDLYASASSVQHLFFLLCVVILFYPLSSAKLPIFICLTYNHVRSFPFFSHIFDSFLSVLSKVKTI